MLILPVELLILAFLVFANGVLAMAETAIVSTRKARLRKLARAGDKGAAAALTVVEQPARFLALVEFWLTLSILAVGVLAGASFVGRLAAWLAQWPALAPHATWISVVLLTFGLTSILLVFGELVPKRIGLAYPERVAALLARSMRGLTLLVTPVLKLFEAITELFAAMLGARQRTAADTVGDDEVRALIEKGLHAGVFHRAEKEMVEGVLALDQRPVTSIMTPRPKIVFLNVDDPEDVNWRKIVASGHSYFPVYQANRDQVIGMVAVKALWAHSAIGLPTTLKNLLSPALFVPETMTAIQMLEEFKHTGKHIAVVTDEFGAVQGLVTLIDVMEAIVGDMPERSRNERPETKRRDDGSWVVDATLSTAELKTLLSLEVPLPHEQDAEFQTLGGFVVTQFGRIPMTGDSFEWAGWRFEVVDMDRRRVDKVLVARAVPPAEAAEEKASA
jgi:putative hemolysin